MQDPRSVIDREPMSRFQWGIVATMVGLNALDGFDVLMDELTKGGLPAAELDKWREDLFADLLKLTKAGQ